MSTHATVSGKSKTKIRSRGALGKPKASIIVKFLVLKGIVKKEKHALFAVFSCVILLMTASLFLIKKSVTVPSAIISPELVFGIK